MAEPYILVYGWPEAKKNQMMSDIFLQQHSNATDNAKLIVSTFTTWYTFFWTLNIAALGILYKPQIDANVSMGLIVLSVIFSILNMLGIGVCYYCWKSMSQLREEAVSLAECLAGYQEIPTQYRHSAGLLPRRIWSYMFLASAISLLLNIIAWSLLPLFGVLFA